MKDRVILHSDLNNFYAAVECLHHPELRGKPVAVCGDAELRHGIVLAKNYEAKAYGVRTGDAVWEARLKCPSLNALTADFRAYLRFSQLARDIYARYTDRIESFGVDECWLDVTGEDGRKVADDLRERVQFELGITASVGVSWNKIFAKLGSDYKKPDATTVIDRENYRDVVWPLPAGDLLYVGPATKAKLGRWGIRTIGELAAADSPFLKGRLGKWGEYLQCFARGADISPVALFGSNSPVKSVGNSATAVRDLYTAEDVTMLMTVLSESVAARLKEQGLKGCVVCLHVRDNALAGWTAQRKLAAPTSLSEDIIAAATRLFTGYDFRLPVRSLGVKVSDLTGAGAPLQTDMFLSEEARAKKENLEYAIEELRRRFGHFAVSRATEYLDRELTAFSPKDDNTIHPYGFFR